MATLNRNRIRAIPIRSKTDFTKVGGLSNHIKLLREIIILPLLYGNLYHHFNIKAPRGVIFYGPPGTGKTLVAGALANELNKEGHGKVTFFQRKGADILDKWVGESEKKLRELFEKATRSRPSVIFFDELDGLAPERSIKNDQVHSSVVATLLALMDGLDNMSGVIVIGATNRIDSIDPALRRPGRFDRELYFPLPSATARKEILQVHTKTWKHKPSPDFLCRLADLTAGCCGSDLQALCAESVMCCLKRKYPTINQKPKIDIEVENLNVEEQDFMMARTNIIPTSQRLGNSKSRRLSPFIKPLLQRQIDKIVRHIQVLLPHFTQIYRKFIVGSERYAGRLVLRGTMQQGLNTHIVPALLQTLEHVQSFVLDIPTQFKKVISSALHNLPSILVLSRVDDWWDIMDTNSQMTILSMLDDLHAGLPILLIATCYKDLPNNLQDHFYYNSSIVIEMEDPTDEERERFFAPLFFGTNCYSVYRILKNETDPKPKIEPGSSVALKNASPKKVNATIKFRKNAKALAFKDFPDRNRKVAKGKVKKRGKDDENKTVAASMQKFCNYAREDDAMMNSVNGKNMNLFNVIPKRELMKEDDNDNQPSTAVTDLVNCRNITNMTRPNAIQASNAKLKTVYVNKIKTEAPSVCTFVLPKEAIEQSLDIQDDNIVKIYNLWKRVSNVTSDGLPVVQLELLYDTILACIYIHNSSFAEIIDSLYHTLNTFEVSWTKPEDD